MADMPAEREELTNHYLDMEETLKHCHQREVAAFGHGAKARPKGGATVRARREVSMLMAALLCRYEAMDWLPMALTILDALGSHPTTGKEAGPVRVAAAHPVSLAAIVRLVVKQVGVTSLYWCHRDLGDEYFAEQLAELGEGEIEAPAAITQAELDVVKAMDGRVVLTSPAEWADLVSERLRVLVALRPPALAAGWDAAAQLPPDLTERAVAWACYLAREVAATADLPPRALGLTACACALVTCGALQPSEAWPQDSPPDEQHGSFLRAAVPGHAAAAPFLRAATLSEAAGCSEQEFRESVRAGSTALQAAAFGESGPDRRSH